MPVQKYEIAEICDISKHHTGSINFSFSAATRVAPSVSTTNQLISHDSFPSGHQPLVAVALWDIYGNRCWSTSLSKTESCKSFKSNVFFSVYPLLPCVKGSASFAATSVIGSLICHKAAALVFEWYLFFIRVDLLRLNHSWECVEEEADVWADQAAQLWALMAADLLVCPLLAVLVGHRGHHGSSGPCSCAPQM